MSFFTSWDVLSVSLVLSLEFLAPFAFGVSLIAWTAFRPSPISPGRALGIALGVLVCLAPVLFFLVINTN